MAVEPIAGQANITISTTGAVEVDWSLKGQADIQFTVAGYAHGGTDHLLGQASVTVRMGASAGLNAILRGAKGQIESWQKYDLSMIKYDGGGGGGWGPGNDPDDPEAEDIQAYYPFEQVTLDVPETKNGQDFTLKNDGLASTVSYDQSAGNWVEGAGCWKTLQTNDFGGGAFFIFYNKEDDMLSDMPGKEGTSNAISTTMFWYKQKPHTSSMTPTSPDSSGDTHTIELDIRIKNVEFGALLIGSYWRRDGGDISPYPANQKLLVEYTSNQHDSYPDNDKWYHYTFWKNGVTGARKISIWDPRNERVLGTDKEYTVAVDSLPYPDFPFNADHIQAWVSSTTNMTDVGGETAAEHWVDELIIAKAWLSDADVLLIRQGKYPNG